MANNEKEVLAEMNEKLKELENCDGFWIAITKRDGKILSHWQSRIKMSNDNVLQSLTETEKLIGIKAEPRKINAIQRKFH